MTGADLALRIVSLVLGVALAGGSLTLIYYAYVRPGSGDSGCLSFIAAMFALGLAVGLILAGVAGPEAAADWFL